MYIKRYTIASAILIALVGWYVYAYITQATMSIGFFGIVLPELSISLWVILPLVIFPPKSGMHKFISEREKSKSKAFILGFFTLALRSINV